MRVHEQMRTPTGIQAVVKEWWDFDLTIELAEELCVAYIKQQIPRIDADIARGYMVTAAGPLVWLKSRIVELGLLTPFVAPLNDDPPRITTAVLHVGFLMLHETEEMLERLHNEQMREDVNKPARSKMFATAQRQAVAPIDALASVVTRAKE